MPGNGSRPVSSNPRSDGWRVDQEWSPDGVLDRQLAMNRETWAELQRHGVTEDKQLRLDFAYEAPDRHSADTLARFLQNETDYDVQADAGKRRWLDPGHDDQRRDSEPVDQVDGHGWIRERSLQVRRLGRGCFLAATT